MADNVTLVIKMGAMVYGDGEAGAVRTRDTRGHNCSCVHGNTFFFFLIAIAHAEPRYINAAQPG